ncbi:TRAP transporter small permease [Pseudaminobacter sp. 19-2017]|uniref:TRAP transporter small permease protein n=1 Tax=Pseudaminobacter soli (ex Zhang et al. 2022) TaxID=2831468 RepID=A0A942DX34_9HYPH|nr:TRAP transporter small permease [Pseudaminobacter soli]MBS3648517.1 TRAP transporter small permease [Pseudaminobacter soli]
MIANLNRYAATLAGIALLLMAIVGALDVVGATTGRPLVGTHEITETLMVIAIFMALASAQQRNAHIRVELFTRQLSPSLQVALSVFALVCSLACFALIAYFGWSSTLRSISTGEFRQGQLGFPVWPARMALALGSTLMVLQCLREIFVGLTTRSRAEQP